MVTWLAKIGGFVLFDSGGFGCSTGGGRRGRVVFVVQVVAESGFWWRRVEGD